MSTIEKKVSTLPIVPKNHTLKNYLDKLVPAIKDHTYFDYEFVVRFTRPGLTGINTVPISSAELFWAEKIFGLYDGVSRNCDDILTILLDHLIETGFLGRYEYRGPKYIPSDEAKICRAFKGKSFYNIFNLHSTLKYNAMGTWIKKVLNDTILSHQFIDNHGCFLGVGNWDISISDEACDFNFEIFDRFCIFQDHKTKKLHMKDNKTGNIKDLSGRKKWGPDMIRLLEYLIGRDKLSIDINEFAELIRAKTYKTNRSKPESSALSDHARAMRYILSKDFGIEDSELFFSIKNGVLTLNQKVTKNEYCSVKR